MESRGLRLRSAPDGCGLVDRYTLEIRAAGPYPQLLYTLAMGYSAVVPREAVESYGREFGLRPVGSGPFRVTSYDTATHRPGAEPNWRWRPVDSGGRGLRPGHAGLYRHRGHRRADAALRGPADDFFHHGFRARAGTRSQRATRFSTPGCRWNWSTGCWHRRVRCGSAPTYEARYQVLSDIEAGFV